MKKAIGVEVRYSGREHNERFLDVDYVGISENMVSIGKVVDKDNINYMAHFNIKTINQIRDIYE